MSRKRGSRRPHVSRTHSIAHQRRGAHLPAERDPNRVGTNTLGSETPRLPRSAPTPTACLHSVSELAHPDVTRRARSGRPGEPARRAPPRPTRRRRRRRTHAGERRRPRPMAVERTADRQVADGSPESGPKVVHRRIVRRRPPSVSISLRTRRAHHRQAARPTLPAVRAAHHHVSSDGPWLTRWAGRRLNANISSASGPEPCPRIREQPLVPQQQPPRTPAGSPATASARPPRRRTPAAARQVVLDRGRIHGPHRHRAARPPGRGSSAVPGRSARAVVDTPSRRSARRARRQGPRRSRSPRPGRPDRWSRPSWPAVA